MPQTSLTAWLSKSQPQSQPNRHGSDEREQKAEEPPFTTSSTIEIHESEKAKQDTFTPTESTTADLPPLPSNVEIRGCTKDDVPALKRLTSLLLPIPYPEKFYREILDDPVTNELTLLALWHDTVSSTANVKGILVGAVRCRLLSRPPASSSKKNDGPMLYLSTLLLLSPYRGHGIASHMLKILIDLAAEDYGVTSVGAHVWEANADGLEWYRKRGFQQIAREDGYYRRLDPSAAIVVQKMLQKGE